MIYCLSWWFFFWILSDFDYFLASHSFFSVLQHFFLFWIWLFKMSDFFPELPFLPFQLCYRKILCIRYFLVRREIQIFCSTFKAIRENLKLTWFHCFISESCHSYGKTFYQNIRRRNEAKRTGKAWPLLWAEYDVSLLNYVKCAIEKLEMRAYLMLKYLRA